MCPCKHTGYLGVYLWYWLNRNGIFFSRNDFDVWKHWIIYKNNFRVSSQLKQSKEDFCLSSTLKSAFQFKSVRRKIPSNPLSTLMLLSPWTPHLPPVSVAAWGEVAYLCSCQSAASSSAGAPASRALLSPSPAWLSWSSPPSPSSCGSPSLLPDEAHEHKQIKSECGSCHLQSFIDFPTVHGYRGSRVPSANLYSLVGSIDRDKCLE